VSVASAIATLGGLGRLRPGPGTIASLLTVFAAWGLAALGGRALVLGAGVAAMALGGWAAEHYARERGILDPSDCVIDEVAGQFLACAFAPRTILGYALAFAFFRALDILKPWPVGAAERLHGGLGIVADDVVAGVLAGLFILILAQLRVLAV
jgi:phosphatidylglycerophosphatase A